MPRRKRYANGLAAGASGTWGDTPEPGLIEQFKQEFASAVTQLDDAANAVPVRIAQLNEVADIALEDENDYAAWQSEMTKLQTTQNIVSTAQASVAQVTSWWNSAKTALGLGRLGFAFVIPWTLVAGIAAAGAAITAIILSSGSLINTLRVKSWTNTNIARVAAGLDPIPEPPPPVESQGMFSGVADIVKTLLYAGGAYLIYTIVMKNR